MLVHVRTLTIGYVGIMPVIPRPRATESHGFSFLDSDRSREKRALFQDGARPRRTCRVEFVERSPRRQVVGSNPAGPKFCFAPEHKLSVCAPSEVLLRLTPHNLQRTACPLGAQAGRPVFRHAPKLRFSSARGSVRSSCSVQELSDCRT